MQAKAVVSRAKAYLLARHAAVRSALKQMNLDGFLLTTPADLAYLKQNKGKPGVITTASGLQYEVLTQGSGPHPTASDTVAVHYEGKLIDGTIFDSSYQRGQPATFPLGSVIPGWTEGVQLMTPGSKYRFTIPPALGYGAAGAGGVIPPNAVLLFDIELLAIRGK